MHVKENPGRWGLFSNWGEDKNGRLHLKLWGWIPFTGYAGLKWVNGYMVLLL